MTVVSRTSLGDKSHLIVVDVTGADGERRRLLVGTGTGAPSLVADLGAVAPTTPLLTAGGVHRDAGMAPARGSFLEALHSIGQESQDRRTDSGARLDPSDIRGDAPDGRGRLRGVAAYHANAGARGADGPALGPDPRRRTREDAARSLVDEVLAERGTEGPRPPGVA